MLKKIVAAAALACALVAPTAASAANIGAIPLECKGRPGCFFVFVKGDIVLGDEKKFDDVIKANGVKMAVVGLASNGGNPLAAYAIGNTIREKGYTTYVPGSTTCASSCAIIWVAGTTRQADEKARIGFHGVYTVDRKGRATGASNYGNALIGSYLSRMGMSDVAIMYLTEAGPNQVNWLTGETAAKYSISVNMLGAKDKTLVVGPWDTKKDAEDNRNDWCRRNDPAGTAASCKLGAAAETTSQGLPPPKMHDCRTAGTCTPNPDPAAPARHDCRATGTCTN
jgi:hypothetical protein